MKKAEFIKAVATTAGVSEKVTDAVIDATLLQIQKALASGGKVDFVGFGSFKAVGREERKGRNPRTGEELIIPAHKVPAFKASKNLKENVAGGKN